MTSLGLARRGRRVQGAQHTPVKTGPCKRRLLDGGQTRQWGGAEVMRQSPCNCGQRTRRLPASACATRSCSTRLPSMVAACEAESRSGKEEVGYEQSADIGWWLVAAAALNMHQRRVRVLLQGAHSGVINGIQRELNNMQHNAGIWRELRAYLQQPRCRRNCGRLEEGEQP